MSTDPDAMAPIRARLEGGEESLFGPGADEDAERLAASLIRPGPTGEDAFYLPALHLLIEFHAERNNRRPGPIYADLGQAARLMLLREAMGIVPLTPAMRETVAAMGNASQSNAEEGQRLLSEYFASGDPDTLESAITRYRCALNLAARPNPTQTAVTARLANAIQQRFYRDRRLEDLDEAIDLRRQAVAGTSDDDPERPLRLSILAELYAERVRITSEKKTLEPHDLELAIAAARASLAATPPGDSHVPLRAFRLGDMLMRDFARSEDMAQLEEAIRLGWTAVDGADAKDVGPYVSGLGTWLVERADRTNDPADLDTAISLRRRVLIGAEGDTRLVRLTSLGTALYNRYQRRGEIADLDEAIAVEREAVAATPVGHADRAVRLANLAVSLRDRYQLLRQLPDLDDAIAVGLEAVQLDGERQHVLALSNLSTAFLLRYEHRLEPADLQRAVSLGEQAVADCPAGDPDRAMALGNLAYVYITRQMQDGEPAATDDLVRLNREALAVTPRHDPDHVLHLSNLGSRLFAKYEEADDPAALAEALTVLQEAVETAGPDHPMRFSAAVNLARARSADLDRGGSPDDFDRAIDILRDLIAAPSAPPWISLQMGVFLEDRYHRRSDPRDIDDAIGLWEHLAANTAATAEHRMSAAAAYGRSAFRLGDRDRAADAYETAMRMLDRLTWHGLTWNARQSNLAETSGVASSAATAMLAAGRRTRAVELLEQGRSVIWNQMLRIRTDMSELDTAAPDLAAELRRTRELLDAPGLAADADVGPLSADRLLVPSARERRMQEQMRLAQRWDDLIAQVEQIPQARHLFAPTPFADLAAASTGGPVVLVNLSELGCQALIVKDPGSDIDVLDLSGVTLADTMQRTARFLNVLVRAQRGGQRFIDYERDRHEVFDLLEWMWEAICEPILDRLGMSGEALPLPRLWWCPTGALALLPLHAAGRYPRHRTAGASPQGRSVGDRVVSSYTPTLTALLRARQRAGSTEAPRQLAIGMPATPGYADLPGVLPELEVLAKHFPEPESGRRLVGAAATREAVRTALAGYPWIHFACHAEQDLMHPDGASFVLVDGPLRVRELIEADLPQAQLAYLSACETATGGAQLPDEAIHLAAAMQTVGYRHVIATMWHVADSSAPEVAAAVYGTLIGPDGYDVERSARALHTAVAALRADYPTDPLRWASYIHMGP